MRYSLTSRIKGALIGALLGQSLTTTKEEPLYCNAAVQGLYSLLSQGGFNLEEYNQQFQQQDWDLDIADDLMLLNSILATLPIALFFHENHLKLRENLLLIIKDLNHPLIRDGVLSVCYLIAQSLNEKINQNTLISEITYFIGETKTELPEKLRQVNNLIAENAGYFEFQNCFD